MLFMYQAPELPSFLRRGASRRSSLATISGNDVTSVYAVDDSSAKP